MVWFIQTWHEVLIEQMLEFSKQTLEVAYF